MTTRRGSISRMREDKRATDEKEYDRRVAASLRGDYGPKVQAAVRASVKRGDINPYRKKK